MTNERLSEVVHSIIRHALDVRDRLDRGEDLSVEMEQMVFKSLLLSDFEAQQVPDFGEDETAADQAMFFGARYALVCWLDELFTQSCWAKKWSERPLESALYGMREGEHRFWEQAALAETREGTDALEVFFLCVVLGFRGERRNAPDQLRRWMTAVQARMTNADNLQWQAPSDLEPQSHLPRLRARRQWQRLVVAATVAILAAIPTATFLLVRHLAP